MCELHDEHVLDYEFERSFMTQQEEDMLDYSYICGPYGEDIYVYPSAGHYIQDIEDDIPY